MIDVVYCIGQQHDPWLVGLALLVCLVGSAATVQLFGRIRASVGSSRAGWLILSAVGSGTMVWCTHFVAMMAFKPRLPVRLDPTLTLLSLAIAIVLAAPGLALAATPGRYRAPAGGVLIGGAIAAMHYAGMMAYRLSGVVEWRPAYVVASVVLSAGFGAVAFAVFRADDRWRKIAGAALLALAVASLHFTGMTAMRITVLADAGPAGLSDGAQTALAVATACAGLLFIGCAAVSALIDGQTQGEAYRRLRRMALHDGLTDLPNRTAFNDCFGAALRRIGPSSQLAVVMVDLSGFKGVNDTHGHSTGDEMLVAVAGRMRTIAREDECFARLGGDEFAALLPYRDRDELDQRIGQLRHIFDQPFALSQCCASLGASFGIALAPANGQDPDALLARADLAMYRAKHAHLSAPCFYDAGMDDAERDRRDLVGDLRAAVATGAFQLHYQVQAALPTGEITGYEALIRWHHPRLGPIPPAAFIPLAEEIGEIVPLSNWVLRRACFEAALQRERRVVSVNLSPLQLADPLLIENIRRALDDSGLPPERLALELTESAIIRDRAYALTQLAALRAMGIKLSLDDFGVGYSSLDVLRAFTFDCIKLDASFVAEIEHDRQAVAILRSVTTLCRSLGVPVLAEGVENAAQLAIVAQEDCAAVQGFLIGRPSRDLADPAEVVAIMQRGDRDDVTRMVA